MRSRSISPAYRQNLYQAPEVVTEADPDMPRGQVIALLRIRKREGDTDSLVAQVLAKLLALGNPDSGQMDRAALIADGYIQFDGELRDFVLLPRGLFKAQALARELAKTLGVHHIAYRSAARGSNRGPTVACSCGWNTWATKTNANTLRVFASRHLEKVEAGTDKPLGDIVEKIVSKLLDSGSAKQYSVPQFAAGLMNPGANVSGVPATAPGNNLNQQPTS